MDGPAHAFTRPPSSWFRCPKPIIAAVQGPGIGGGLGLALVADFRIVTPEARFAANFVSLGIHPGLWHHYDLAEGDRRTESETKTP